MTTAKRTHPNVLELDVDFPGTAVVVVVGWDVVVVACARVVVVAGSVVVVVGAVVGGTVVVVVGANVVVVTGAVVVVVSWAAAVPDRTPSSIGVPAIARNSAGMRRETFGIIRTAYGSWLVWKGDHVCVDYEKRGGGCRGRPEEGFGPGRPCP